MDYYGFATERPRGAVIFVWRSGDMATCRRRSRGSWDMSRWPKPGGVEGLSLRICFGKRTETSTENATKRKIVTWNYLTVDKWEFICPGSLFVLGAYLSICLGSLLSWELIGTIFRQESCLHLES